MKSMPSSALKELVDHFNKIELAGKKVNSQSERIS